MKNYREPEMEVVSFSVEDVVTLSAAGVKSVAGYESSEGFETASNGYTMGE